MQRLGIKPTKGILLWGPPGCAKTCLVRAAASTCNINIISASSAHIYSPHVGAAEAAVTELFTRARLMPPAVIFLDELDALVGSRAGDERRSVREQVLATLLNEMDGVGITSYHDTPTHKILEGDTAQVGKEVVGVDNSQVVVVGATNRPDLIDSALLRPGRMDRLLYVPPPDVECREQILRTHTRDMPLHDDVDLQSIANNTHNYSGADLKHLCTQAGLIALTVEWMRSL